MFVLPLCSVFFFKIFCTRFWFLKRFHLEIEILLSVTLGTSLFRNLAITNSTLLTVLLSEKRQRELSVFLRSELISNTFAAVELNPLWEKVGNKTETFGLILRDGKPCSSSLCLLCQNGKLIIIVFVVCCYVAKYHSWKQVGLSIRGYILCYCSLC